MRKSLPFIAIEMIEKAAGSEGSFHLRQIHGQFRIDIGHGAVVRSFTSASFVSNAPGAREKTYEEVLQFAIDHLQSELETRLK